MYLTSSSISKEELEEKSELHYFHHYEDAGELLVNSSKIKKNHVIIKIKDNAHGIENSALPHIFKPYFTTKDKSKGTGLGLNITYNLVTKGMNGSMEAYNVSFTYNKNEYTGAEFRLELPYE